MMGIENGEGLGVWEVEELGGGVGGGGDEWYCILVRG